METMDKYEVYVTTDPSQPREMFRIRVRDVNEIVEEVNSRYQNITECTACKLSQGRREYKYFNINEGKVIL